jgi:PAS domain S-box-containing protein
MDNREQHGDEATSLRRRAEAMARILATKGKNPPNDMSPEEVWYLVHDLQVHQIELEMQNEELRRAHAELEIVQSRYFELFDVAPVGYVVIDGSGLITEVNLTTAALLGFPRADMTAQPFTKYIARQDQDNYYFQRKRLFETGTPICCDLRLLKLDGTSLWAHMEATVARSSDGTPLCRAVLSDITERKRFEAEQEKLRTQLAHSQRMESVGRLAGGVAHDFNNMLAVIIGNTELALREVAPGQPPHAHLQDILKAARRSADVARQLLNFSSRQEIHPEVLDLNEAVGGTVTMLQRLIGEDIQLRWTPGPGLWPVRMDPSQLDQVLANLCINARTAIADVGEVCIETGNATLDETRVQGQPGLRAGDFVRLVVSDNGSGMDEATAARVFEPFFTTQDVGKGAGLGLASVHGSITRSGGFMDLDTRPGRGTTFFIYLPRYLGTVEPAVARPNPAPLVGGHETVLLVEDEPAVLEMTTLMLERQGYRVLAAGAPEAAIRVATEHAEPIHLLMTDVVMPGMNGRDLAAALKTLRPQMKCLFMSGFSADVAGQHGEPAAGRLFLQKPFSHEQLLSRVREVLVD